MSEWRDTPPEDRVLVERLDGERVRFNDVRAGEVFRFVAPHGGYVDVDCVPTEEPVYYRACEDPRPADGTESSQDFGWCMPVEEVEDPKAVLS